MEKPNYINYLYFLRMLFELSSLKQLKCWDNQFWLWDLNAFHKNLLFICIIILNKHTDFDKGCMATFHFYNSSPPLSIYEWLSWTTNPLLYISSSLMIYLFSISYIGLIIYTVSFNYLFISYHIAESTWS